MILIPFETITFRTALSEHDILQRLDAVLEPEKMITFAFFRPRNDKKYYGKIEGDQFEIFRKIKGRNSFQPIIIGSISSQMDGTIISVTMRLHLLVIVFLFVWCGFVFMSMMATSSHNGEPMAVPCGMLLFAYLLTIIGFNMAKTKDIETMQEIFEAEIIKRK